VDGELAIDEFVELWVWEIELEAKAETLETELL
jgi:hypothetical protein